MTIGKYHQAIRMLQASGLSVESPIVFDKSLIKDFEKRLGVVLPKSYIEMLLDYGSLEFDTFEVYGITKNGIDGKSIPNAVFATEDSRSRDEIKDTMVEVMASGYGPRFVIDCGQMDANGEAPVYEVHERGYLYGMKKVADSFGEFLLDQVNLAIESQ
jgi:hypothetical protein